MRNLLAIGSAAGAVGALTGAVLLFNVLKSLCMLHAASAAANAEDLVLIVSSAASVIASLLSLLSTVFTANFPAGFYRGFLLGTVVLGAVAAAAAGKHSAEVLLLRGPASKTKGAARWSTVARCLAKSRLCSTGDSGSPMWKGCCSKPAGCRPPKPRGDDCHRWHPGTERQCFACSVCRTAARREVRLRSRTPISILLSGVALLLGTASFHLYAEVKGKFHLPPRPITTTVVTTTRTTTSAPAATAPVAGRHRRRRANSF